MGNTPLARVAAMVWHILDQICKVDIRCAHPYDMLSYVCLRQNSEKLLIVVLLITPSPLFWDSLSLSLSLSFPHLYFFPSAQYHLQTTQFSKLFSQATGDGPLRVQEHAVKFSFSIRSCLIHRRSVMAQTSRTVENIVWLESLLPSESALYDSLSSLVVSCMTLRLTTPRVLLSIIFGRRLRQNNRDINVCKSFEVYSTQRTRCSKNKVNTGPHESRFV